MIKTCPCCYMQWEDQDEPIYLKKVFVCHHCRLPHTQEDLIYWQLNHIDNIDPVKLPKVFKHMISYLMEKIKEKKDV